MLLLAIVLPAVMQGITLCVSVAGNSRDKAQAAALAHSTMMELLANDQWDQTLLSGDYGSDSVFHWTAEVVDWSEASSEASTSLRQLNVTVNWQRNSRTYDVTLSTVVNTATTTATSTSGGTQ